VASISLTADEVSNLLICSGSGSGFWSWSQAPR